MQIVINNADIVIKDATTKFIEAVTKRLSYKDKSMEYQIRRMESNPFQKNSAHLKKLKKEMYGNLVNKINDSEYVIPSGFYKLIPDSVQVIDNRKETGTSISLPWDTKPFNLRPYQEEALEEMECHAAGQLILMFDGSLKKIEDIKIGDSVMGPDSKPRRVTNTVSGETNLYTVTPTKGESFVVTGNHQLSLRRSYSSRARAKHKFTNKYRHRDTIDEKIVNISVLDYLNKNTGFKHKYKLYRSDAILFKTESNLQINPYILGAWLGDGASNGPEFSTADLPILNEFQKYAANNNLSVVQKDSITYRLSSPNPKLGSNSLRTGLQKLNLIKNKHIPSEYLTASINQRLELLAGLLDTDGCNSNGTFDITQKREKLANDICFLARSLGFAAYKKKSYKCATNSKLKKKNLYFRVSISGDLNRIPTRLQRKQITSRKQIKNVLNVGLSISDAGIGKFYGISVDTDHLYVMGDFTVTHNCNWRGTINFATGLGKTLTAVHAIRKFKKKALIVCPGVSIADNFYEELSSAFGEHRIGYYGNGKKKIKDITVAVAASVNNNIEKFKDADLGLIIFDEVHHLAATTFFSISEGLSGVGRMYGLTATNFRSDGKDVMITAGVGPNIIQRDLIWGIQNKYLANPYIVVREILTTGRDIKGDKLKNYKEHVLKDDSMNRRIISDAQKFINAGKSTLILVKEVEHGEMIAERLGLPLAVGKDKQSSEYVKQLNEGKIPGLVGTDSKIGEGTDTKNVDVLILANFVASKGPLWQNLGRGLRIHNGNDKVIVLDYLPAGSKMLTRHAKQRVQYYKEITENVKLC